MFRLLQLNIGMGTNPRVQSQHVSLQEKVRMKKKRQQEFIHVFHCIPASWHRSVSVLKSFPVSNATGSTHTHTHSTSSKPRFRAWFILCVKYMIYDMIYLKHHRLQTYTQHRVLYVLTCRIFRAFLVHFVCILHACKGWNAKWTSHEQTHKFAQDWDTINVDVETCRTCAAERLFSSPCIADMLQQVKSPPNHAPVI